MKYDFGKVGVLYGGKSAEREISLMSGLGVHEALLSKGVDAHLFDTGIYDLAALAGAGFSRVFIALHGRYGEDGTLQGALEFLGIPYTGSGPIASALAMDKILAKRIWLQHGLPTPAFEVLGRDSVLRQASDRLGFPLILKPPHEGSTVGVSRVNSYSEIASAYQMAAAFGDDVLAEQFIIGRELTVALLGKGDSSRACKVIEIIAKNGNYNYENKYFSGDTQYRCPANLPDRLDSKVREIACQAYRALGCESWGRVDFIFDRDHRPWLLEMNTSPGMTSHSLMPMAALAEGLSYAELCLTILAEAACKVCAPARNA